MIHRWRHCNTTTTARLFRHGIWTGPCPVCTGQRRSMRGAQYVLELAVRGVAPCAEEGVVQHHIAYIAGLTIFEHVLVKEEEHGKVDLLAGEKPLLLEAEALDLGKVRRNPIGDHVVRGNANNILVSHVVRLVECQCRLAWQHVNLALLWRECPGDLVRRVRRKSHTDTLRFPLGIKRVVVGRCEPRWRRVSRGVCRRRAAEASGGAKDPVKWHRRIGKTKCDHELCTAVSVSSDPPRAYIQQMQSTKQHFGS